MDKYVIQSVLGFDLNVDITDNNGQPLRKGVKASVIPNVIPDTIATRIFDKNFFTHYNEALIAKIRDFRRLND